MGPYCLCYYLAVQYHSLGLAEGCRFPSLAEARGSMGLQQLRRHYIAQHTRDPSET